MNIQSEIRLFLTSMTFFTRIPCSPNFTPSEDELNHTLRYFSFIGILVGAASAIIFWAAHIFFSIPVAILLSIITTVWLTGAFHEDGFADVCDGFGGGWTKEQILAIMKDSRVGTYGIIGMGLLLALKFFALYAIPVNVLPLTMLGGHSLSRFAATLLMYAYPYVRQDDTSKVSSVARQLTFEEFAISAGFGILPLLLSGTMQVFLSIIPVLAGAWLAGRYFAKHIGGYTGDCLGAVQQFTEVIFYLFIGALWKSI